jgi:diaminohydroxyphosphoribosylaminopyrimidine deaminase/5-amino-6-(5-phosphoribosylamino)uracil reductase
VTLEPCAHHGKTPPCADALVAAGVSRVVYATADPTAAAGGATRLTSAGIAVEGGVEETAAREINAPFFHAAADERRPFITIKLAITLDSAIADAQGRSKWITGPSSRREVHRLRAAADAIAVGIETVLAGVAHQGAPDGERVLLATAEMAAFAIVEPRQKRKELVDPLHGPRQAMGDAGGFAADL